MRCGILNSAPVSCFWGPENRGSNAVKTPCVFVHSWGYLCVPPPPLFFLFCQMFQGSSACDQYLHVNICCNVVQSVGLRQVPLPMWQTFPAGEVSKQFCSRRGICVSKRTCSAITVITAIAGLQPAAFLFFSPSFSNSPVSNTPCSVPNDHNHLAKLRWPQMKWLAGSGFLRFCNARKSIKTSRMN